MFRGHHRVLFGVLATVLLAGCAFRFLPYERAADGPRDVVQQVRVRVRVANPEYDLQLDSPGQGLRRYPFGSRPSVERHLVEALTTEMHAAGFSVVSDCPCDFDVVLHIERVAVAEAIPFYGILINYFRNAAVVDLRATASHLPTGRVFQRRFAVGRENGWLHFIFIPIGYKSPDRLMLEAEQQCLSELVGGMAELAVSPDLGRREVLR